MVQPVSLWGQGASADPGALPLTVVAPPRSDGEKTAVPAPTGAEDFARLFEQHHRPAYRLALLLCGGEALLAEDSVSEAFSRAYPKWKDGGVDDFGSYLRRAVANEVKGSFRRRLRQRRLEERRCADDDRPRAVEDHVVDQDQLWMALRQLPHKQRTAIVLRYYEDRPLAEIAEIMGTAVGTAKAHVCRGRERLRALLEEGDPT